MGRWFLSYVAGDARKLAVFAGLLGAGLSLFRRHIKAAA
jgi:hypothetical protein